MSLDSHFGEQVVVIVKSVNRRFMTAHSGVICGVDGKLTQVVPESIQLMARSSYMTHIHFCGTFEGIAEIKSGDKTLYENEAVVEKYVGGKQITDGHHTIAMHGKFH